MQLILGISPCPNDTFMFDAMLNGRIDTEGLEFDVRFADIEELNDGLMKGIPHVSKCSYAIIPQITGKYLILNSGSALGNGNGPLLVSADDELGLDEYDMRVAIPGINTTANLLMERLYPRLTDKTPHLFSDIMGLVSRGVYDAGVLIHEGRFVYHDHGLALMADLGIEWEKRTRLPLPLGAIAVSRDLPEELRQKTDRVLNRSIRYALDNPGESSGFVKSHAQEMDERVIRKHIALFVNDFSLDIGDKGRDAVHALLGIGNMNIFA